jgi:two-component system, OmpR family, sensor histidine kinase QseC
MQRSLTRHLLAWALGALALVWGGFIAVGIRTGMLEADELTDGHLASVAALLLSERNGSFGDKLDPNPSSTPELRRHDYQQSMSVVVWDRQGRLLTRTGDAPMPPFTAGDGFADLELGEPAQGWRAYSRWGGDSPERRVMVLRSVKERDELAWDIIMLVVEPGLWLLPVIALVLGLAIVRGLRPLYRLSHEVRALDVSQATRLHAEHPHEEFRSAIAAINQLVDRQQAALHRERQLASEMAHELRTPMAAIALHAAALGGASSEAQRGESLARLEHEVKRAGQVLAQLLALARASHTELAEAAQPLDLAALAARLVASYGQAALDAEHELALVAPEPLMLNGHAMLLEMALRNLIDNALAHTPPGTLVEVQIDAPARWLQVCDNGAAHDRRGTGRATPRGRNDAILGLGLGHRVVEKVASVHAAGFAMVDPPDGFDTCYRLTF